MNGKVQAHNKKKLNVEGGCHTHCARVNKDQFRFYQQSHVIRMLKIGLFFFHNVGYYRRSVLRVSIDGFSPFLLVIHTYGFSLCAFFSYLYSLAIQTVTKSTCADGDTRLMRCWIYDCFRWVYCAYMHMYYCQNRFLYQCIHFDAVSIYNTFYFQPACLPTQTKKNIVDFHMKFDIINGINRLNTYLWDLNKKSEILNDVDSDGGITQLIKKMSHNHSYRVAKTSTTHADFMNGNISIGTHKYGFNLKANIIPAMR